MPIVRPITFARMAGALALVCVVCFGGGCSQTPDDGSGDYDPKARERDRRVQSLLDRVSGPDGAIADAAAQEIALFDRSELSLLAALWAARLKSTDAAVRIGIALQAQSESLAVTGSELTPEVERIGSTSLEWLRRGLDALRAPEDYIDAAYVRLVMARAYLVLGRGREAFELLANRLDTRPLPSDMEEAYDALLQMLSSGAASR